MDVKSIFQTWVKVLTSPSEEVFVAEREKSSATLRTALVWVFLASVIAAILGVLQSLVFSSAMGSMGQIARLLPAELQGGFEEMSQTGATGGTFGSLALIIVGPIGFLIVVGIFHVTASILGGHGQYGRYAYLTATFSAPLVIVSSLLAFVPIAGSCLGLSLAIYQFVLAYFAIKVEYGLSQGRAIVAVVAPGLILLVLVGCIIVVAVGAVMSAFQ